jgi:protein-L-isoaspartate(D-aspartate) O-methyltransferase
MMSLEDCRSFYAEEIRFAADVSSTAVVQAFARVPRENFLGAPPWRVASPDRLARRVTGLAGGSPYVEVRDARDLYHNVLVAIDPARQLNNGQPSALAAWMDALDLQPGDRIYHLGCGVGYYTAVLAEVVGCTGSVIGSEVDAGLAASAALNLAAYANVRVHASDGAELDPGVCDAILINAGVTHPHRGWLERLSDGGRMVLPITARMRGTSSGQGVVAKIVRRGDIFSAQVVTFVAIYSCTSVRDANLEPQLGKALAAGTLMKMRSVRLEPHELSEQCLLHRHDLCISLAPAE